MQVDNKIQCSICGQSYHIISPTHLNKKHKLTIAEYRKLFPHAPITSPKHKATLVKGNLSKIRKKEENQKEIECEWCEKVLIVQENSKKKFCSQKCSHNSRKGIALSNTVKKKIAETLELRKQREVHPWEQLLGEESGVSEWLKEIFESLSQDFTDIRLSYKLPNGYIVDIALLEKKIGINFTQGWTSKPSVNPYDAEAVGWNCCDVFSQNPKKAIHVLKEHIGKVGNCPSVKTPDFRYVSNYYNTYKDSIGSPFKVF